MLLFIVVMAACATRSNGGNTMAQLYLYMYRIATDILLVLYFCTRSNEFVCAFLRIWKTCIHFCGWVIRNSQNSVNGMQKASYTIVKCTRARPTGLILSEQWWGCFPSVAGIVCHLVRVCIAGHPSIGDNSQWLVSRLLIKPTPFTPERIAAMSLGRYTSRFPRNIIVHWDSLLPLICSSCAMLKQTCLLKIYAQIHEMRYIDSRPRGIYLVNVHFYRLWIKTTCLLAANARPQWQPASIQSDIARRTTGRGGEVNAIAHLFVGDGDGYEYALTESALCVCAFIEYWKFLRPRFMSGEPYNVL